MTKNVKNFSIREAIVFGEKQFKKYWFILFSVISLDILIEVSPTIFKYATESYLKTSGEGIYVWYSFLGFIFSVIIIIATVIMHFNIVKIFIDAAENKKIELEHLFDFNEKKTLQVLKFIIASIIYEIVVITGLILLVIPGMILGTRFAFVIFLIVEKNMDIIDAFKESWNLTKGHTINLMKFFIVSFVVASAATLVGLALFLVGVIPMIIAVLSILTIANIHIYRHLQGKAI